MKSILWTIYFYEGASLNNPSNEAQQNTDKKESAWVAKDGWETCSWWQVRQMRMKFLPKGLSAEHIHDASLR